MVVVITGSTCVSVHVKYLNISSFSDYLYFLKHHWRTVVYTANNLQLIWWLHCDHSGSSCNLNDLWIYKCILHVWIEINLMKHAHVSHFGNSQTLFWEAERKMFVQRVFTALRSFLQTPHITLFPTIQSLPSSVFTSVSAALTQTYCAHQAFYKALN